MFAICAAIFSYWNSSRHSEMVSRIKIELLKNRSVVFSFNKLITSHFGVWNFGLKTGKVEDIIFDSNNSQVYCVYPKILTPLNCLKNYKPGLESLEIEDGKTFMMLEYKCSDPEFTKDLGLGEVWDELSFNEVSVLICRNSIENFISKGIEVVNMNKSFPCDYLRVCNIEVSSSCNVHFPTENLIANVENDFVPESLHDYQDINSPPEVSTSKIPEISNGNIISIPEERDGSLSPGKCIHSLNGISVKTSPGELSSIESLKLQCAYLDSGALTASLSRHEENIERQTIPSAEIETHILLESKHIEESQVSVSNELQKVDCVEVATETPGGCGNTDGFRAALSTSLSHDASLMEEASLESDPKQSIISDASKQETPFQARNGVINGGRPMDLEVNTNHALQSVNRANIIHEIDHCLSAVPASTRISVDNKSEGPLLTGKLLAETSDVMDCTVLSTGDNDSGTIQSDNTDGETKNDLGNWTIKFNDLSGESLNSFQSLESSINLTESEIKNMFKDLVLPETENKFTEDPVVADDSCDPWSESTNSQDYPPKKSSCHSSRECLSYGSKKYNDSPFQKLSQASSLNSVRSLEDGILCNGVAPLVRKTSHRLPPRSKTLFNITLRNFNHKSNCKPPNILIYTNNDDRRYEAVKNALLCCINSERYILYPLKHEQVLETPWPDNVTLLVVVGHMSSYISQCFIKYLLAGGKVLSICSNLAEHLLKDIRTTEFQEEGLVSFNYKTFTKVELLHHFKCYHIKPSSQGFSPDEHSLEASYNSRFDVEYIDKDKIHNIQLEVLASDPTWHSPIFLKGLIKQSGGSIVISQVHLEVEPQDYQHKSHFFTALHNNNAARLMLLQSLLLDYFQMDCQSVEAPRCTLGYLCGTHQQKMDFLSNLKPHMSQHVLKRGVQSLKFLFPGELITPVNQGVLPVLVSSCPSSFSTVEYFEALKTKYFGRIVIYAEVLPSTSEVLDGSPLGHGVTVITRRQTKGRGRGGNAWLSPEGCCMFSLQIILPLESPLGKSVSILQHLTSLAVVTSVTELPGYQDLKLKLKWPNDIYYGERFKLGGVIVNTSVFGRELVCNIGCGVNLNNSQPTTCINDLIKLHNTEHGTSLPLLSFEKLVSEILNTLETLCSNVQENGVGAVLPIYYRHWLHNNAQVTIHSQDAYKSATIVGIDSFGYLLVKVASGKTLSVHPDGNSFDMLHGLIIPKYSFK